MRIIAQFILVLASCALLMNCSKGKQVQHIDAQSTETYIPSDWIANRVDKARVRLDGSEGGKLIWKAVEAHGGLTKWFANGFIGFRFDYYPLEGTRRNTYQVVDQWSARAVHAAEDSSVFFGWDGNKAWVKPDTARLGVNPRFWSLTPYYFIGLPFVLADEGVNHEVLGQDTLNGDTYHLVKATFSESTGDAPDDYYIVYLHPKTGELAALRYVVSYPGFFPHGGHSPEKLMVLTNKREVQGVLLAGSYKTYAWNGKKQELRTNIQVSDYSFQKDLSRDFFNMPTGAKVQENL